MEICSLFSPFAQTDVIARFFVPRIQEAINFARIKHKGQFRKTSGEPYINHPIAVAWAVAHFTDDIDEIIAAVLHDVVEDCYEDEYEEGFRVIAQEFNQRVSDLVRGVTKLTTKADGTRDERAVIENNHLASGCKGVHLIKTCDIYHNCHNAHEAMPIFAKRYIPSKIKQVAMLVKAPQELLEACLDMLNNRLAYVLTQEEVA